MRSCIIDLCFWVPSTATTAHCFQWVLKLWLMPYSCCCFSTVTIHCVNVPWHASASIIHQGNCILGIYHCDLIPWCIWGGLILFTVELASTSSGKDLVSSTGQLWNDIGLLGCTVRPRDTLPQAARTLQVHVFKLGPKKFELNEFMVKTLSSTVFRSFCFHRIK